MSLTVGIAGLSGRFGRLIGEILLKRPASEVKLRGFCREPRKLAKSLSDNPRVEVVQGSAFDSSAARTFAKGCDVVICCYLGADKLMIDGQKLLVDACEAEGVSRFLASDWTIDYTKLEYGQLFPKDPMKRVKDYLDTKERIKGVHVLIGAFMDTFFTKYFDAWDPEKKVFTFWGTGDEVLEFSSYRNSAEYTAAVALDRKAVGLQKCECIITRCRNLTIPANMFSSQSLVTVSALSKSFSISTPSIASSPSSNWSAPRKTCTSTCTKYGRRSPIMSSSIWSCKQYRHCITLHRIELMSGTDFTSTT